MLKNLNEIYTECELNGSLIHLEEIDKEKIKTFLKIAKEDIDTVNELKLKNNRFNTTYKLIYDIIHTLTEAILILDKVKSTNHKCLFAHLCFKHPELNLDWNFFEKIRIKRNKIHYDGALINNLDLNEINIKSKNQINILMNYLKSKI